MDTEGLEHPDTWAVETFGTTELGDLRRTDRLVKMATAIAENPSASLPESMRNWGDTLAAYRFLDNPDITHEQIMLPHWMNTRQEAMQRSRVLLAADTTDINLSSHEAAEGLGPIGRGNKAQGFFVHTVLAMDAASQQLLGCIYQEPFVRQPARDPGKQRLNAKSGCESPRCGSAVSRPSDAFQTSRSGSTWQIEGATSTRFGKRVNNWDMTLSCVWLKIVGSCSMKCQSQRTPKCSVSKPWLALCLYEEVGFYRFPPNGSFRPAMPLCRSVGKRCVSNRPYTQRCSRKPRGSTWIIRVWEPEPPDGGEA